MSESVTSALNGDRDPATGRVLPGNKLAKGNPQNRRMHELRAILHRTLEDRDLERIVRKLIDLSAEGDVAAARLLLDHALGKPPQAIALSGPNGEPLALGLEELRQAVLVDLAPFPDQQILVAQRLRQLALSAQRQTDQ